MEELEVTLAALGRVVWKVTERSVSVPGFKDGWEVVSLSRRGAQKQVTSTLTDLEWSPVGRWVDGTRIFVRS